MGLDMYLYARRYVSSLGKENETVNKEIKELLPELGGQVSFVTSEVAYWRKANAIHRWFVENVQNGNDDCGDYYVDRDQLAELLQLVNDVLEKKLEPEDVLPTQEGFFFGNAEYNEWYYEDLENTKQQLEDILGNEQMLANCYFYYHSSW